MNAQIANELRAMELNIVTCFNHHCLISREYVYNKTKCYCGESWQSSGYLTKDNWHLLVTCVTCHQLDLADYAEDTKKQMIEKSICFNCLFWQEYIDRRKANDSNCFVINGHHYVVLLDRAQEPIGHGGAKFIIKPQDNRKQFITHNLWHQGDIPEHFRNILTDNAEFIKE